MTTACESPPDRKWLLGAIAFGVAGTAVGGLLLVVFLASRPSPRPDGASVEPVVAVQHGRAEPAGAGKAAPGKVQTPFGAGRPVRLEGRVAGIDPKTITIEVADDRFETCWLDPDAPLPAGPVERRYVVATAVLVESGEHKGQIVLARVRMR